VCSQNNQAWLPGARRHFDQLRKGRSSFRLYRSFVTNVHFCPI
jgi:hypothetical protein